jgi:hypothetical protein
VPTGPNKTFNTILIELQLEHNRHTNYKYLALVQLLLSSHFIFLIELANTRKLKSQYCQALYKSLEKGGVHALYSPVVGEFF